MSFRDDSTITHRRTLLPPSPQQSRDRTTSVLKGPPQRLPSRTFPKLPPSKPRRIPSRTFSYTQPAPAPAQQHLPHKRWMLKGLVAVGFVLTIVPFVTLPSSRVKWQNGGGGDEALSYSLTLTVPSPSLQRTTTSSSSASTRTTDDAAVVGFAATTVATVAKPSHSRFAYVYVVGGCDPDHPGPYRNFLYSIVLATHLQRTEGSQQDVIVLVQLSYASTHRTLPDYDLQLLSRLQVQVRYIDPDPQESFDRLMMDKYHLLKLTEYERVLYMDADVMARGSLDYLFELSADRGVLMENLVFAGPKTPALGGIFMVAPQVGDFQRIQLLIQHKRSGDVTLGWGHVYEPNESYQLVGGRTRQGWDFPTAFSDEGLLFHWVKYKKRNVSVVLKDSVQNWMEGPDGKLVMKTIKLDVFSDVAPARECWAGTMHHKPCRPPHSDYFHYQGTLKPWLKAPPSDYKNDLTPRSFWFHLLSTVKEKYDIIVDIENWKEGETPLLGLHPNQWDTRRSKSAVPSVYKESGSIIASPYSKNITFPHRFAYAYVIGGCKPEDPSYRNYLNDIMIATYVAREDGSTADVIILVQMSYSSKFDTLTDEDLRLLSTMQIQIKYIPKAKDESFYRTMLDKFLVLSLTQYERIIFMDGDVMIRGSLDYLCELSVQGVLKRNLVLAGQTEPANGGFFMLAPREGAHDRLMEVIRQKEKRGSELPYPHWDEAVGWGHAIADGDYYQLLNTQQFTAWDFYGAFADQGLLYHWVKYEEKSVSIVFRKNIQNWGVDAAGKVHLEKIVKIKVFKDVPGRRECWKSVMKFKPCEKPHSDFVHFTSKYKPWLLGPPEDLDTVSEETSPFHYWFHILRILNLRMQMGLDFNNWRTNHRPLLGMYPKHNHAAKTMYASDTN